MEARFSIKPEDISRESVWFAMGYRGATPEQRIRDLVEDVIGRLVPGAVVRLDNGRTLEVVVRGPLPGGGRVRSVAFNGRTVTDWKIRHADLMSGGRLEFEMADRP